MLTGHDREQLKADIEEWAGDDHKGADVYIIAMPGAIFLPGELIALVVDKEEPTR